MKENFRKGKLHEWKISWKKIPWQKIWWMKVSWILFPWLENSMNGKFHDRKSSKNENFKRENSKIKTPRLQTPEGNYKTFAVKPVSITTRFVIKQQDPTIPKCLHYLVCVCVSKILLKQSVMLLSPPLKPKEIQLAAWCNSVRRVLNSC